MSDKKEVRSHFTKVRKAARSDEKDRLIAARLMSLEEIGNADTVLMFASFGSEINTWEIAGKLLTAGKKLAYPKCGRGGVMTFHLISGTSDLKANNIDLQLNSDGEANLDVKCDNLKVSAGGNGEVKLKGKCKNFTKQSFGKASLDSRRLLVSGNIKIQ